ncbi:MAG: DUF4330 family protein [Acetivibrionales bacterium]|jgi:hypothetical protein
MAKRKFTWIDLVIIIILLVCIAGTVYKFSKASVAAPVTPKEKILVSFYMENVQDNIVKAIKTGDPVIESVQNSSFGKVTEITTGDSIFWSSGDDGQLVSSSREGYSSLVLTMEAEGIIGKNGVTIGNSVYHVGLTVTLNVGKCTLKDGRISKIAKAE